MPAALAVICAVKVNIVGQVLLVSGETLAVTLSTSNAEPEEPEETIRFTVSPFATTESASGSVLMTNPSGLLLAGLGVLTILVAIVVGRLLGGFSKGSAVAVSIVTALLMGVAIVAEHLMNYWPTLLRMKPRPISVIGSGTPNMEGHF